ncbi:MAG: hypothetical protein AAF281_08750 [Pseudomonadota bacterium]
MSRQHNEEELDIERLGDRLAGVMGKLAGNSILEQFPFTLDQKSLSQDRQDADLERVFCSV